jgi:hypothetical protein
MPEDVREYTRQTLLILWRTAKRLAADTDELRRFVAEGLTECLGKLLLTRWVTEPSPSGLASAATRQSRRTSGPTLRAG